MYKDKEKQKATERDRQRRYRKGVTKEQGVTLEEMGVDAHGELYNGIDDGEMGITPEGVTA